MFDQPYPNFHQWFITKHHTHKTSYGNNIALIGYINTPKTPIEIFMEYNNNGYNIQIYHDHNNNTHPSTKEHNNGRPIAKIYHTEGDDTILHLLNRLYNSDKNFHHINALLHAIFAHLYPKDIHTRINIIIALTRSIILYPNHHANRHDPLHTNSVNIFHWKNITDTSIDILKAWIGNPKIFYSTNNNCWIEKNNNEHILYHINNHLNKHTPTPPSMHTHIQILQQAQALHIPFLPHCMNQQLPPK